MSSSDVTSSPESSSPAGDDREASSNYSSRSSSDGSSSSSPASTEPSLPKEGKGSDPNKQRIKEARKAFKKGDKNASHAAHSRSGDIESIETAKEKHRNDVGEYVKSIVYGGMDGIVTTFAVVAAVVGGSLSPQTVLIMGFSNLVADGISMGLGDFISEHAENKFIEAERTREMWETVNYLDGERKEMVEIMEGKGMSKEDAEALIEIYTRTAKNNGSSSESKGKKGKKGKKEKLLYPDLFVDFMLVNELGLLPADNEGFRGPAKNGGITFASFLVCGLIPLIAYIIVAASTGLHSADSGGSYSSSSGGDGLDAETAAFIASCFLTAATLFALGAVTTRFTPDPWYLGGLKTLLVGTVAAASSYGVGALLAYILE